MAEKDLVYFKQWIPAGHQMDKYSANPWCLFSKNVDIFSSSNSYKATAFSTPDEQADWVIAVDEKWRFWLYSSWKVYDSKEWTAWNAASRFAAINWWAKVNYYWPWYTNQYEDIQFWTPKSIVVKYDWDEWQEIVVFTDRTMFVKSKVSINPEFIEVRGANCDASINWGISLRNIKSKTNFWVDINLKVPWFCTTRIWVLYYRNSANWDVEWKSTWPAYYEAPYLYYDAPSDSMMQYDLISSRAISDLPTLEESRFKYFQTAVYTQTALQNNRSLTLRFQLNTTDTVSSSSPRWWEVIIDWQDRITEYYVALPKVDDRIIKNVWEYYFIYNWWTFPSLWNFTSEWARRTITVDWVDRTMDLPLYTFSQYMWWEIDPAQVAVDAVVLKERVFLICNQDWNWYIFPCDLSWWKGTPYIAYGVELKAAIVMNYLIYLVGENRWISTLFVYNEQELVHVVEWNEKNWERDDYISKSEQFKFNWMMADWRWRLILGTEDNRVFCYWQTYWGRWWAFIHTLEDWQTLDSIRTIGKDLLITYVEGWVTKTIKYQDDTAIKHYNTEFEVVYPIILWNHIIEKEVYDLYCSYRLPSSSTKLEFWIAVNHNYFWSFRLPSRPDLEIWQIMYLSPVVESMDYSLKLVEINDDWYTFILDWNMPVQDSFLEEYKTIYKPIEVWHPVEEYAFTEYNNFKKIREITTDKFKEWYYREENITNKLSLPRTHSIQLMVRWKWTVNHTPEVFWLTLESNQRNRW